MQLAKFKFVALFVLAASLVGGAGLWAGRSLGPDGVKDSPQAQRTKTAEKQKPVAKQAKPKTTSNTPDSWRGQNVAVPQSGTTWQVDWVHDLQEARRLEMDLDEHESAWSSELSKARRELLIAQEHLRQLQEREQERKRRSRSEEHRAEDHVRSAEGRIEELARHVAPKSEQGQHQLREAKDRLEKAHVELQQIRKQNDVLQHVGAEERINARLAVMDAQDRLHQFERRQARERDQIQGDLDLIQERIRRARWGFPPIGAGQDDRLGRKVDQLRQQIEELRHQLRPQTGATAPKP